MTNKNFYTVKELSNMVQIYKEQKEQLEKPSKLEWLNKRLENANKELGEQITFIYEHSKDAHIKVAMYNMGCCNGNDKIYIK